MQKGKKIALLLLTVVALLILVVSIRSSGKTPEQKMYDSLEKQVALEKGFEKQQDPLLALEKKNNEQYTKIIDLGLKELDQIIKLSDEALNVIDQRQSLMDKEQKSMEHAKKQFDKTIVSFEEFSKDSAVQSSLNKLVQTMDKRYDAHDQLYKDYISTLDIEREMYQVFKKDDMSIDELEQRIDAVNASYSNLIKVNERFNTLTKQYNEEKLAFYKKASIDVTEHEKAK